MSTARSASELPPRKSFTEVEVAALILAAPTTWWAAFIHLGAESGLRVGELLRLQWSDLDAKTHSVRVGDSKCSLDGEDDMGSLPAAYTPQQHRIVPIPAAVFRTVQLRRMNSADDMYVFIPRWRVDQLWTRVTAGKRLRNEELAPNLDGWFQRVQRDAQHVLARQFGRPLVDTPWPRRKLSALRETFAVKTSRSVTPSRLKELLGYASVGPVLQYYDMDIARTERGAA